MKKVVSGMLPWYFRKNSLPYWLVLLMDGMIVVMSGVMARVCDRDVADTISVLWDLMATWCCYLLFYLIGFRLLRTYSGILRFSGFIDLIRVAVANTIGIALIFLIRHVTPIDSILVPIAWPELVVAFVFATVIMWTVRIVAKQLYDILYVGNQVQRVFIYGVKEGGVALAKSVRVHKSHYSVAGFVSDDPKDCSHMLMGVKIYYNDDNLVAVMRSKQVRTLMVSPLKTNSLRDNQKMIDQLTAAGIRMLIYNHSEWDGKSDFHHTQLREVEIEDLLPRNQIEIDMKAIGEVLTGKCVLITGAAGSIGSEIVQQVAAFKPSRLVLIDQAETPLHDIRLMMARQFADIPCDTITSSITHRLHMEHIFSTCHPEYVFHAAAYKHVPMMEDNPGEAVNNNIGGTRIMADLAVKYGARKFVMISTDKAVNPTNVMGCSKRICEMYCQSLDKAIKEGAVKGVTEFVTTRFGNVLGSNGSVIPIFKKQIKAGGPLTVTHPEIIRYFMLIPEACRLVLQAGTMGRGGEIFVFDMGKPVKIADLAKRMISLSGAQGVEIKYTGLRDGEKLYEELLNKEENTKPSSHPKIKLAQVRELGYAETCEQIGKLEEIVREDYNDMDIVRQMKVLVPEYKSKHSKYEALDS